MSKQQLSSPQILQFLILPIQNFQLSTNLTFSLPTPTNTQIQCSNIHLNQQSFFPLFTMEDELTLQNHSCLRNYLTSSLSNYHPLTTCINGSYSELCFDNDSDDGFSRDHVYCRPFVVLDVIWNLGFVLVSVFVLLCTIKEKPSSPLRVWIGGYAFQCLMHVGFVFYEFRRRNHGVFSRVSLPDGHSYSRYMFGTH